ncbi:hypothetical protein H4S01_000737 [Coemansia sp. RSA 2610]|nr:hypothetical protein H4S01_000737 [Coemansia sp. RSA 2610]
MSIVGLLSEDGLNTALSTAVGYVSLVCWMVVMFPQIILNYQRKSGEGVSVVMMVAWVCGDVFNISGALLQDLVPSTVLIGSYYLLVDSTLLLQIIYYRVVYQAHRAKDQRASEQRPLSVDNGVAGYAAVDDNCCPGDCVHSREAQGPARQHHHQQPQEQQQQSRLVYLLSVALSLAALGIFLVMMYALVLVPLLDQAPSEPAEPTPGGGGAKLPLSQIVAQAMGTASAVVYIMSYVPQAVQNYQRRSCEGLSIWLFLLSLLGNTTYALAILVVSLNPHYLAPYVPWLLGALVPCLIQMLILYQFHTYPH